MMTTSGLNRRDFIFGAKLEFSGEEGWKKLCESDLDLVVNATPWALHALKMGGHGGMDTMLALRLFGIESVDMSRMCTIPRI